MNNKKYKNINVETALVLFSTNKKVYYKYLGQYKRITTLRAKTLAELLVKHKGKLYMEEE
jgi:hypothetical protein